LRKPAPDEEIPMPGSATVGNFWSWAYSGVLGNTNRAVFTKFLVGSALGATVDPGWSGTWQTFATETKSNSMSLAPPPPTLRTTRAVFILTDVYSVATMPEPALSVSCRNALQCPPHGFKECLFAPGLRLA